VLLNVVWVTGRASACKKFHTNNLQRFCFERPSWNLAYHVMISRKIEMVVAVVLVAMDLYYVFQICSYVYYLLSSF